MYSRPVKMYSGLNNPIKILCFNQDQKLVDISNTAIQFNVFYPGAQDLIISKAASVANSNVSLGLSQVTLGSTDLAGLTHGFYEIGITGTDQFGNVTTLYIDDNYGSRLGLELLPGPVSADVDPIQLTFLSTSQPQYGNIAGIKSQNVNLTNTPRGNTNYTIQANLVQYTGDFITQATVVSEPTWPSDFGNIAVSSYANYTGPIMETVSGTFAWLTVFLDGTGSNGRPLNYPNFAPVNTEIMCANLRC